MRPAIESKPTPPRDGIVTASAAPMVDWIMFPERVVASARSQRVQAPLSESLRAPRAAMRPERSVVCAGAVDRTWRGEVFDRRLPTAISCAGVMTRERLARSTLMRLAHR